MFIPIYIIGYQSGKHQILYHMMDSIAQLQSTLSFALLILTAKQSFLKQDHTYISWYKQLIQSIQCG